MYRALKTPFLALALLAGGHSLPAFAETTLAPVAPADVSALGFSPERLERLDQILQQRVDDGELGGIVVLIARHGQIAHFNSIGYSDVDTLQPMENDDIFRIYSMTKPIVATGLMMLFEEGRFRLSDPISKYLPEFSNIQVLRTPESDLSDTVAPVREPTIHDVLRHTAGFTGGRPPEGSATDTAYLAADLFDPDVSLEAEVRGVAEVPLTFQPGEKFEYGLGLDIAARLIEVMSGQSLREYLAEHLFVPLGMDDTDYFVDAGNADRLVEIAWQQEDGTLASCTPENCFDAWIYVEEPDLLDAYRRPHASTPGSYGMVSTASDYFRFAQMMQNGGEYGDHRFLSPATVDLMAMDHLGSIEFTEGAGHSYGLGFGVVTDVAESGEPVSEGTFFWSGYAGTSFLIDPERDLTVVVMTQHMHVPEIWNSLSEFNSMIYGTLAE